MTDAEKPEGSAGPLPAVEVLDACFEVSWPRWRGRELDPLPEVCFAGRSNVGKSSLLNCLVNRRSLARASNTPGRTQALNVFRVRLRRGEEERFARFVDLPGYGYAKAPKAVRAQWGPMMESYFRGNERLRVAIALFDIRHTPTAQDGELLEMLRLHEAAAIAVATKSDKVGSTQRAKHLKEIARKTGLEAKEILTFSAQTRQGREGLLRRVWEVCGPLPEELWTAWNEKTPPAGEGGGE